MKSHRHASILASVGFFLVVDETRQHNLLL